MGTLGIQVSQVVLEFIVPFSGVGPVLSLTCGNPPDATVGVPYLHLFPAAGGTPPYTFSLVSGSFPPGLVLNPVLGFLSGVPTAGGPYSFTIQVQDSAAAVVQVTCGFSVLGMPVVITLRGINRRPCCEPVPEVEENPKLPSVERVL